MKIHVLSDLHLEFADFVPPRTNADIVVLAGDTHLGDKGIAWAQQHFSNVQVVLRFGQPRILPPCLPPNWFFDLKAKTRDSNIHILENDVLTIGDVSFLGCTLWTDFALLGEPKVFGQTAMQTMSDYKKIRTSPQFSKLRSVDAVGIHQKSRRWLEQQFGSSAKRVVVTHHAPSLLFVPLEFQTDQLSPAYASSLDDLVRKSGAALWIHGHLHERKDYVLGQTRVLCNPRGYSEETNSGFFTDLVVEV